jgi:Putative DNA-binding domain
MRANAHSFHQVFVDALLAPHDDFQSNTAYEFFASQPGFSVYRNTVLKGWVDALHANFPAVARLVGDDWFRAAAAVFALASPPTDARMLQYGELFPAFLSTFDPAAELPFLASVATLDRCWTRAHIAVDEAAPSAASLTALSTADLNHVVLRPRASASWAWHSTQPIYSLWRANRSTDTEATIDLSAISIRGEGAVVLRTEHTVESKLCDEATVAFLSACRDSATVTESAAIALNVDPECDLQNMIAHLLTLNVFSEIQITH